METINSGCLAENIQEKPSLMFSEARAHQKRKSEQEGSSDFEYTLPNSSRCRGGSKRRMNDKEMLDDRIFEKYLRNLWRSFSNDRKDSFAYLDCMWFRMYLEISKSATVLKWIKKEKIFSKKYVFVPICNWNHWSLLIFCHLGETLQSKSRTPCMLLLDPVQSLSRELQPFLRKFLVSIYKAEERPETKQMINKIPLLIPKVPQQKDDKKCGHYVLYYLNLFLISAPETFNISKGYPYFMNEEWFTAEDVESFFKTLDASDQDTSGATSTKCGDHDSEYDDGDELIILD